MKKIDFKTLIPYISTIVAVILFAVVFIMSKQNSKLSSDLQLETKLKNALLDTVKTYKNERNELVSEKLTLQFKLNEKEFENYDLVKRIKETEKKNATLEKKVSVFAAALIRSEIIIDSLQQSNVNVSEKDSSVTFTSKNPKELKYTLLVKPVLTLKDRKPELTFVDFSLPNEQFIEFHWINNVKEGYPVSFSVTNTNRYFKTVDINSYVIPEIIKPEIKPTFWQKLNKISKSGGADLLYIGIGVIAALILK